MTLVELLNCRKEYDLVINGIVKPMTSLQFSQSSMSVYVQMIDKDTIYNHMIICMKDGKLCFTGLQLKNKETEEIVDVDSLDFDDGGALYQRTDLSIVRTAVKNYYILLSIKSARSVLYPSQVKLTWAGGNTDYSKEYNVLIKNMEKPLGRKSAIDLLTRINNNQLTSFTNMQAQTLEAIKEKRDFLVREYPLAQDIYDVASFLYAYRVSCMNASGDVFPVKLTDDCWIVEENKVEENVGEMSTVF